MRAAEKANSLQTGLQPVLGIGAKYTDVTHKCKRAADELSATRLASTSRDIGPTTLRDGDFLPAVYG